ncbi:hypothetical protein AB0N99_30785 [Streptomyces sp. NPDC093272]|uniref:hypothetical protein n=1 Tax=Streptomyces sp. NPDC093272 TaxID=3154981 RepID=UPI003427283D
MACDRCRDTGIDPLAHAYIVQRGADGTLRAEVTAPCPNCQPDDQPGAGPANGEETSG